MISSRTIRGRILTRILGISNFLRNEITMQTPKKLFLIDAMAMAFRSYHAFSSRPLTTAQGHPSSALYGCAVLLQKLLDEQRPDYIVIASDSKAKTFRHDLYPQYKANRGEMPEDLAKQIAPLYELFAALGCMVIKQPGFEADDLIGSLVRQFASDDVHCYIVSGDKDFMQLVDENVFLLTPGKGGESVLIDHDGVLAKFGVPPEQVRDVLALMGDSSDNVPGVRGIGPKGAMTLIANFKSLENVYANLAGITNKKLQASLLNNQELAELSKQLVTIRTDIKIPVTLSDMTVRSEDLASDTLLQFFETWEFRSLAQKVKQRREPTAKPALYQTAPKETGRNYRLVDTRESLGVLVADLASVQTFAFDTETTGLDIISARPIGMSFATREKVAYYVPLIAQHLTDINPDDVKTALTPALTDPRKTKVAHNLKFDLQMLRNADVPIVGPFGDSMLAAFITDSTLRSYGIDALSKDHLGVIKIATEQLMGKDKSTPMLAVERETLAEYACEDADCCLRLYELFMIRLNVDGLTSVYHELEVPLIEVLADMEQAGVSIDVPTLQELSLICTQESRRLEHEIHKLAGQEFNIGSPKQLQKILFEDLAIHEQLGIKNLKRSKQGFSTDVSVLEALAEHPLPDKILEYRMLIKLKNTYTDTLPQLIHPQTQRVHTSFNQTGTSTGRLSSTAPNLQNIPIRSPLGRRIRGAFKAPRGSAIISADYSQIELRLLAHLSGDENLQRAFRRGGDIHRSTAALFMGISEDTVTGDDRSRAKAINYGIVYGMGAFRLAKTTGLNVKDAKEFIERYFASFPQVRTYLDFLIARAEERGYSETISGRRRLITGFSQGGKGLANARNIAVNSPIQGSNADLIKLAMIKIHHRLRRENYKARMLVQVHDELLFECPHNEVDAVRALVKAEMEGAMQLAVPLIADVGVGADWLEAHE